MPRIATALVTGASSGLGRELVRQLVADRGVTVLATARRRDRLEELSAEFPEGRVRIQAGDLLDPGFREELWNQAVALPGGLDILINNAGMGHYVRLASQGPEQVHRIIELNVIALIDLSQRAMRYMQPRGSGQIVQISSALGFMGLPYSAVYVASKHAVNGLVKCMRYELRGTGVRVWAACPGRTQSEFSQTAMGERDGWTHLPRGESTSRVVRAMLRGLDRRQTFLFPTWIAWGGVFLDRWLPFLYDRIIVDWATRHLQPVLNDRRRAEVSPQDRRGD